jgi:hypothetical protein
MTPILILSHFDCCNIRFHFLTPGHDAARVTSKV